MITLQGINISRLGKRKIIFKMPFLGDLLVPWRVIFNLCYQAQIFWDEIFPYSVSISFAIIWVPGSFPRNVTNVTRHGGENATGKAGWVWVGWLGLFEKKESKVPPKNGTVHPRNAQKNSLKKPNEDTCIMLDI